MQIKRFEAKNMTDALRQIKRTLGPEAVILSAKDLRKENRLLGISRQIGVEVTAAVDEDYPSAAINSSLPDKMPIGGEPRPPSTQATAPHYTHQRMDRHSDDIVRLNALAVRASKHYRRSNATDRSCAYHAAGGHDANDHAQAPAHQENDPAMERYLAKSGLSVATVNLNEDGPTLISLVGNAGVGKTVTVAKLAAAFKYTEEKTVGLLSLDGHRIGGYEQLQCYADSMQLPLASVQSPNDLGRAMERLQGCRIILIDTPAVQPGDTRRLAALEAQFQHLGDVQVLLLVSAENREADLSACLHRFAPLNPVGAVISKTDLTGSYADLVNFLCRHGLAVHYYCAGPRVPFDLTKATIENLTARFLSHDKENRFAGSAEGHASTAESDREDQAGGIYLANKNSDIFHRPGCKWIRLINRSNIVELDSFGQALNHRFKPCRYCNPQHLSITGILSRERAAL